MTDEKINNEEQENIDNQNENSDIKNQISDNNEKKHFFNKKCKDCEKYKQEADEYKAGWQRAQADYQNLKKEIENMRGEWVRYSEQQILEDFIPVYDHLQLAVNSEQLVDNKDPWLEGVRYVGKQFEKILKDHNVEKIKTVGEIFDPCFHEAVAEEDSDLPEHTIIKETEAGYTMKGKVIKVAKVIVAKKFENSPS